MAGATLMVVAAFYHTCAIHYGNMKCWGANSAGQLGYNHTANVLTPENLPFVPVGRSVIGFAGGSSHSCAVLTDGNLKCWGGNSYGQLGYNHTNDVYSPADVGAVPVGGWVAAVTSGQWHTCALIYSGDVKCWGYNANRQLGYNHTNNVLSPADVGFVPVGGVVTAVAAGYFHTCAVLSGGAVKCWGDNSGGQLGYNHTNTVISPENVGYVAVGGAAISLAGGLVHTCALLSTGDMKCWGSSLYGQLGYSNTISVLSPANVGIVATGENITAITAGVRYSCALLASRNVKCWGANFYYQLGYINVSTVSSPLHVPYVQVPDIVAITAGYRHTCAARASGGIACWGWNVDGQLGYNDTASMLPPQGITAVPVAFPDPSPSPTMSISPTATASGSVSPTHSSSLSASPTSSATASRTASPFPSMLATPVEGAREARIPLLQVTAVLVNAYADQPSVTRWMNGGDVPPQLSLHALWQLAMPANATDGDTTSGQVVLSDALPPAIVLIKVSAGLQDYSGVSCRFDGGIGDFSNVTYTRVHVTPASLFSAAPSRNLDQHFHAFSLGGERTFLRLGDHSSRQFGFLQCSPTFHPSLYVPYYPRVSMSIRVQAAVWAVPRGAIVASASATRSVGMPPPSCFELRQNGSGWGSTSPWHTCTALQLATYVETLQAAQLQPSWSPSTLDLNGASNITFIFQLTYTSPHMLAPNVSITIGNASCMIVDKLLVNDILFVRCLSPDFEVGCVRLSGSAACAPQRLSVHLHGSVDFSKLSGIPSGVDDIASISGTLPTLLRCDPFCDLMGTPTAVRTLVRDASAPTTLDGTIVYDAPAFYEGGQLPLVVVLSGPRLQKRPPVTYIDVCIGYTNPLSDICMNTSMPEHNRCAFGGGNDCRPCPRGALCPGGYRALPTAGFWAASISSAAIVECAPPTERCLGWDLTINAPVCADGYDAHSPGCGWCENGYFKARSSGECTRCPSVDDPSVIILPIILLVAVVVGIVAMFMAVVWVVSKVFGGTMQGGVRRVVEFASAVFQSIQLVSTVTSAAGNTFPPLLQPIVDVLNALQIQGILVEEACMQHQDLYIRVYVLSGFALLLASALTLHYILITKARNACSQIGSKVLALFLACYGLVAQTVMSAYQCTASTIPLRSALPILSRQADAGQSVLATNGIRASMDALAICDANEFLEGCAALSSLLSADVKLTVTRAYGRTDICAGTAHAPALGLATVAFTLALLTIPLALLLQWRKHIKAAPTIVPITPTIVPITPSGSTQFTGHHLIGCRVSAAKNNAATEHAARGILHPDRSIDSAPDAFTIFLHNQRYTVTKAYWWQLDCLLLLTVAVAVHAIGKPTTLLGIWLQAAAVCGACVAAMIGKIITKPYKPENFHLFIAAISIQAYSVLIQMLLAISYAASLPDGEEYATALSPMSIVCLIAAVLLLLSVGSAFLYSLVGGAITEQRLQQRALRARKQQQRDGNMTNNPLLAFNPISSTSRRILATVDGEEGHMDAGLLKRHHAKTLLAAATAKGMRQTRESFARQHAPIQLRRANRSNNTNSSIDNSHRRVSVISKQVPPIPTNITS